MIQHDVVLIDPSETREVLSERLRMQGYIVTATSDPGEGAHMILSDPPAAVIADLWMPGISGVQLCRLLRSEPATMDVPVILRGPEQGQRERFWAERAGASAYVARGRMGDLVRAIDRAIETAPRSESFFTQFGVSVDIRDRIAAHLDSALFDSVVASEVRALSVCGSFARLFDLLSQFAARVSSYRWMAVYAEGPDRLGIHGHASRRSVCDAEARAILGVPAEVNALHVEDEDACFDESGPPPIVEKITLGREVFGRIALAPRHADGKDEELVRIIARELSGPIRIVSLVEESQRLAMYDPLTGLMNRRAFSSSLDVEIARAERHGLPLAALLLDIDHFKSINDRYGHPAGDAVLMALGRLLSSQIRKVDLAGRWGGEEFVLALTGATEQGALASAERIRAAVEALDIRDSNKEQIPITISLGVAPYTTGDNVDTLLDLADRAMYQAKSAGRNRVVVNARGSSLAARRAAG